MRWLRTDCDIQIFIPRHYVRQHGPRFSRGGITMPWGCVGLQIMTLVFQTCEVRLAKTLQPWEKFLKNQVMQLLRLGNGTLTLSRRHRLLAHSMIGHCSVDSTDIMDFLEARLTNFIQNLPLIITIFIHLLLLKMVITSQRISLTSRSSS